MEAEILRIEAKAHQVKAIQSQVDVFIEEYSKALAEGNLTSWMQGEAPPRDVLQTIVSKNGHSIAGYKVHTYGPSFKMTVIKISTGETRCVLM